MTANRAMSLQHLPDILNVGGIQCIICQQSNVIFGGDGEKLYVP
jgi:hypothetical protein